MSAAGSRLVPDLNDPTLKAFAARWQTSNPGRAFPARADFDPTTFPPALMPYLALADVVHDPLRFRWRVVGTWWRDRFNFEGTGRWVDEWPDLAQRDMLLNSYGEVIATRQPVRRARKFTIDNRPFSYECVILPLSEDDVTISMLLVAAASGPD